MKTKNILIVIVCTLLLTALAVGGYFLLTEDKTDDRDGKKTNKTDNVTKNEDEADNSYGNNELFSDEFYDNVKFSGIGRRTMGIGDESSISCLYMWSDNAEKIKQYREEIINKYNMYVYMIPGDGKLM